MLASVVGGELPLAKGRRPFFNKVPVKPSPQKEVWPQMEETIIRDTSRLLMMNASMKSLVSPRNQTLNDPEQAEGSQQADVKVASEVNRFPDESETDNSEVLSDSSKKLPEVSYIGHDSQNDHPEQEAAKRE